MKQYYFENKDSERCYNEEHFNDIMEENGIDYISVLKAIKVRNSDVDSINCKYFVEVAPRGDSCGKGCEGYKPRNKISGCCIHVGQLYEHGDEVTLHLEN